MWDWLVELQQQQPYLPKALLAGSLVSTVCGVVGCFIILRRMAFLADALAHSMLAGVVCGYLFMKLVFQHEASAPAMILGSLLAGVVTVLLVGFVSRFSRVKEDTVIGIMYTGIFALGGVLLSFFSQHVHIDLVHFLTGQLLAVRDQDLWMMAGVSGLVMATVVVLYRPLQLITFDRVMAASLGMPVLALDYTLTTCTSLVVVSGVNVVGIILVVGLLIIPAATAYLLCDRLHRMLVVSAGCGMSSFLIGYFWSSQVNVAPGSAIVVTSAAQFLLVFQFAPRYGLLADWQRRRRTVPLQLTEDILGCLLRTDGPAGVARIREHVTGRGDLLQRALRVLEREGLLEREEAGWILTKAGRQRGRRLLRAHRLWETYLQQVGTPLEEVHEQAHVLEHAHDEATVEYLDDRLGHPLTDPHGSEIPEDPSRLVPGAQVRASVLREGRRATVTEVGPAAAGTRLHAGMQVQAGPRQADRWTLQLDDGIELQLDHEQADDVLVQLLPPEVSADRSQGAP